MLLQKLIRADSGLVLNMTKLGEKLESIEKKITLSPWIPIVATVAGGLLVWIGQYFDRKAKRKQELTNELYTLVTKCEMLSASLKNALKELATQKNLREYWWYCYFDEYNARNRKDMENEKKYLQNHHAASDALIKCNFKIGDLLAEYYSAASKIKFLTRKTFDLSFIITLITSTKFSNAKEIPAGLTNDDALDEYEKNCDELAEKYYRQFEVLEIFNETLKPINKIK